jgi:hypothetical protein
MNKAIAVAILLACVTASQVIAPQVATAADDVPYVDGLIGAFGGMTVFPDNAYSGSFGPQADLVLGPQTWHLRPLIGAGASFNTGPAPYDFHLRAEAGAAIRVLGGIELGLGSVFVPQDGALEWSTMYLGLKKSIFAVPLDNPAGGGASSGVQFELGPYFRYHMSVADETSPVYPSAGIVFGISRE